MHDNRCSVTLGLAVVWALATASAVEAFSGGISTLSFGAAGCNSTVGGAIDPKRFGVLWGNALRACGVRSRGLYTTKDTFVSLALRVRGPLWVERQTGVAYATLRKHYAKWMPQEGDRSELERLSAAFGVSGRSKEAELSPRMAAAGDNLPEVREKTAIQECRGRDLNPHGVTPTEF